MYITRRVISFMPREVRTATNWPKLCPRLLAGRGWDATNKSVTLYIISGGADAARMREGEECVVKCKALVMH